VVGYQDDAGGTAEITVVIKGQGAPTEYTFQLDGDTGTGSYRINGVALQSGQKIELKGDADGSDLARLDYLDILTEGSNPTFDDAGNATGNFYEGVGAAEAGIRLEVEDMDLAGGATVTSQSSASNGSYVAATTTDSFNATSLFQGETGYYDVVVGYYDDNSGAAELNISIDNTELSRWFADLDLVTGDNLVQSTVAEAIHIDQFDLIEIGAAEDSGDQGNLDYIQFIKVEAPVVALPDPLRVEAEAMDLSGNYRFESRSFASGDRLVKTNSSLTATTAFDGPAGLYNIVIGYYDENDGQSPATVSLDGQQLDSWTFDQNLGHNAASSTNFVTRTIEGVTLDPGATLALQTSRQSGEYARIDYVEFVAVAPPTPVATEEVDPISDNGDVIRGGAGNDTAYGGEGDDYLYGGSGDDVLYGDFSDADNSISFWSSDSGSAAPTTSVGTFDGDDTHIIEHTSAMLVDDGTLSFYFQADSVFNHQGLFSKDSYYYGDGGHLTVYLEGGYLIGRLQSTDRTYWVETRVNSDQAYDVALTFGDRGLELWLDGNLASTNNYTGGLGTSSQGSGNRESIVLGANQWASSYQTVDRLEGYFSGTLRDVHLYDQQLSKADIVQLPTHAPASANRVWTALSSTALPPGKTGNDSLFGGTGNDSLFGDFGDDILNGTDAAGMGFLEVDTLTGGAGADVFILGDEYTAYYSTGGDQDHAVITDFAVGLDALQLHGSMGDYQQSTSQGTTYLYYGANQDLIAQFAGAGFLDLNAHATFV
jgi:hypothetical protein